MSNKNNDERSQSNLSSHSEDKFNLPKSRLSSASKNNEEDHFPISLHNNHNDSSRNSPNQHKNESRHDSHSEDEDQPSMNDSLSHINQPSNDGPLDNHSYTLSHEHISNHFHDKHDIDHTNNQNLDNSQHLSDSSSHNHDRRKRENIPHESKTDEKISKETKSKIPHPSCTFRSDKKWLDLHLKEGKIDMSKTPEEIQNEVKDPPGEIDENILDKIQGSIFGMALGDALGAHVEFRPYEYMQSHKVTKFEGGGTWGLEIGQFTDDTSMGLCLANSLIARRDFIPYDQLVRYKWWFRSGYMSSTGHCFDIGAATSQSIHVFEERQKKFANKHNLPEDEIDQLSDMDLIGDFDIDCSEEDAAGNGALMRLTPVPLFFFRNKYVAVEFSGRSGEITHGDKKAYDACRYYGALIVAALHGFTKDQILAKNFYSAHRHWFGEESLHEDIQSIAEGSFKNKKGHEGGIAGKGYIVKALEAALWAFWSDGGSFEKGACAAVNLGDDTDTTAAIYGQLAGAYYGFKNLPKEWIKQVCARKYLEKISKWIAYEGDQWEHERINSARSHK